MQGVQARSFGVGGAKFPHTSDPKKQNMKQKQCCNKFNKDFKKMCCAVLSHFSSVQFSSVAQSCPTLCDPMNRSTPGLPVHHQLPEFTQTHIHQVCDAIQPSHPLCQEATCASRVQPQTICPVALPGRVHPLSLH